MAAAIGTVTFIRPNGMTLAVDCEIQDAADAMATFDSGAGGATGENYYQHEEALRMVDLTLAGPTTATGFRIVVNGTPTGQVIRHNLNYQKANDHLCTVATHRLAIKANPPLNIGFAAGAKIQFLGVT